MKLLSDNDSFGFGFHVAIANKKIGSLYTFGKKEKGRKGSLNILLFALTLFQISDTFLQLSNERKTSRIKG
jgi:hypothetical protein